MHYIRKNIGRLLILCGMIWFIYFIFTLVIGVTIGLAKYYSLVLGVFLILLGLLKVRISVGNMQGRFYSIFQFLHTAGNIVLISFIVIESLVLLHANCNENRNTDYIVILGSGLRGDKPTLELQMRLNKGLECIRQNSGTRVVVSGGKGSDETITEAEAMKRYLVKNRIEEQNIIKEDQSTSTFENLLFTRQLLSHNTAKTKTSIVLVTSDFHMFRAKLLAERLGYSVYGVPSKSPWYVAPDYYVREYLAVIKSFILDRE